MEMAAGKWHAVCIPEELHRRWQQTKADAGFTNDISFVKYLLDTVHGETVEEQREPVAHERQDTESQCTRTDTATDMLVPNVCDIELGEAPLKTYSRAANDTNRRDTSKEQIAESLKVPGKSSLQKIVVSGGGGPCSAGVGDKCVQTEVGGSKPSLLVLPQVTLQQACRLLTGKATEILDGEVVRHGASPSEPPATDQLVDSSLTSEDEVDSECGESPQQCDYCDSLKHDSDSCDRTCRECEPHRTFRVPSLYRTHYVTRHRRMNCEECGEQTSGKAALSKHVKVSHAGDESQSVTTFKCDQCGESLTSARYLRLHQARYHNLGHIYCCAACGAACVSEEELERHTDRLHRHTATTATPPRHVCPHCGDMCHGGKRDYDRHMALYHPEVVRRPCEQCGRVYANQNMLSRHKASVHAGGRGGAGSERSERRVYTCPRPGCDKTFVTSVGRKVHFDTVHGAVRYGCEREGCGAVYTTRYQLRVHVAERHAPPGTDHQLLCPQCGKSFRHSQRLRTHLRQHEASKVRRECEHCGNVYNSQLGLRKHVARAHGKGQGQGGVYLT